MPPVIAQLVSACLLAQYVSASLLRPGKTSHVTQDESELSALHEVVGSDGVLVIHLERATREHAIYPRLNEVGIYPTTLAAVDVELASNDTLRQGCLPHGEASTSFACGGPDIPGGRAGDGCHTTIEQAIAESHRQALLAAQSRNSTWTAIFEDDAVPVSPKNFNTDFKRVWAQIPPETGLVRLAWCFGHQKNGTFDNFRLVSGKEATGLCTTAYMVRRDFVPTLLGLFPCCTALDTCYEFDLYFRPPRCNTEGADKCWGQRYMVGIDALESEKLTEGWAAYPQQGILAQDNREAPSIRHQWKVDHQN